LHQLAKELTAKLGSIFHREQYPMPTLAMAMELERVITEHLASALSAALAPPPQPRIAIEKHTAQCLEIALLLGGAGFPEDMPIQDAVRELIHRAALAPPVGRPSIPQQDLPEAAATVLRENLWSLITEDVQPRVGPLTARIDGQELPQSGHEAKSPLPSGRNEWRLDDQGCLDDVVVDDVVTFCLERMNDDHIWGSVYHRDGSQTHFNFFGERLSLTHEHEE
jgi:hypothetical protein